MRGALFIISIVLLGCGSLLYAQAPSVEKVEPPNWWGNQNVRTVRLLVRGQNLRGVRVKSAKGETAVSNLRENGRGDYLFADVTVAPDAPAGDYSFVISTQSGDARVPFALNAPLDTKTNFQGLDGSDVIYLIMTDRFADGDASNNKNVDRANPRAWHGGDFRGIISKLDYLKELGVTAIWLTPWYDNPDQANECGQPWCPYTNYHGYHPINYYAVENNFGSLTELRELIAAAHAKGLKVIQDQVANHVGVQHPWYKAPPLDNWFNPKKQNPFDNSVLLSPNASPAARDLLLKGWFNDLLPDLNQDEPEVARYEIQNALWWIAATGIDGIRQDTIQYMPRPFIRDWATAILNQYPKFYIVGEVFERDSAQTAFFQGGKSGWDGIDTLLPSIFDFNLWQTAQDAFTGKKPVRAVRDVLKYDGLYADAGRVTTLTGNHDTPRFMSLSGATLDGAIMQIAFTLSVRGIPQIYSGDEIAMSGGSDPDNRRDFPGGFAGDGRSAFSAAGRTGGEQRVFEAAKTWIALRKKYAAISSGNTIDLIYDEERYVFARAWAGQRIVIGINRAAADSTASFAARSIGRDDAGRGCRRIDAPGADVVRAGDTVSIKLPARSVVAYEC